MQLEICNVKKQYKDKCAVNGVNLLLTPGVWGLLGANGAGKTTLMRMIAGITGTTEGEIRYDGVEIHTMGKAYRDIFGYLPQEFGFYPGFSVQDYLEYMAALKGIGKKETKEKIQELLEIVSLTDVRKKKIVKLSGGMKRRVGIAQALLGDPEILVLDEPTAGLDPEERIRFRGIISDLSQQKLVLLSTHIVSDLEAVANEIILLRKGVVLGMQKPASLLEQLNRQVWLVTVPAADEAALTKQYTCSNVMHTDGKSVIRLLSKSAPRPDAVPTAPNMEDMYLYYFGR